MSPFSLPLVPVQARLTGLLLNVGLSTWPYPGFLLSCPFSVLHIKPPSQSAAPVELLQVPLGQASFPPPSPQPRGHSVYD